MATVYLRGKIWWARWYRPDGTRHSRSTSSEKKREAARIAAQIEAADRIAIRGADEPQKRALLRILERAADDARRGALDPTRAEQHLADIRRVADPSFRVVSLDAWVAEWIERQSIHITHTTATCYRKGLARLLEAMPRTVRTSPVGELSRETFSAAFSRLAKSSIRAATANQSLRIFRSCMEEAVQAGLCLRNPTHKIRALSQADSTERAPFTVEEVAAIRSVASTEWSGLILLAAHTGLRLSDVVALGRQHIESGRIVIRPAKTSRTRKTITIPLSTAAAAWIATAPDPFFPHLRTVTSATLSMKFTQLMDAAGVPREVTLPGGIAARRSFHSLRHTFVSWLAEADIPADVRKKLSGHATAANHAIYTHHDAALGRAIASLPAL